MIEIQCPDCERVLKVPEKYVGTEGACNYCGGRVQVREQQPRDCPEPASTAPAPPEEVNTLLEQLAEARDEIENLAAQLENERAANEKNVNERNQASAQAAELEEAVARAQDRERELAPRADLEKAQKELDESREFAEWLGGELETSRARALCAEKMLENARAKLVALAAEIANMPEHTDAENVKEEEETQNSSADSQVIPDDAAALLMTAPAAKNSALRAWLLGAGIGLIAAAAFAFWIFLLR